MKKVTQKNIIVGVEVDWSKYERCRGPLGEDFYTQMNLQTMPYLHAKHT